MKISSINVESIRFTWVQYTLDNFVFISFIHLIASTHVRKLEKYIFAKFFEKLISFEVYYTLAYKYGNRISSIKEEAKNEGKKKYTRTGLKKKERKKNMKKSFYYLQYDI